MLFDIGEVDDKENREDEEQKKVKQPSLSMMWSSFLSRGRTFSPVLHV